jgi:predicted HicB family RNase H-like nuclease
VPPRNVPAVVQINYEVDNDLHARVRMAAARERVTIKAFVIAALTAAVERSEAGERGSNARRRSH